MSTSNVESFVLNMRGVAKRERNLGNVELATLIEHSSAELDRQRATIAALEKERDDLKDDYLRRHNDAVARGLALQPFARAATLGEIGGQPPNLFVSANDFESARAALAESAQQGEQSRG